MMRCSRLAVVVVVVLSFVGTSASRRHSPYPGMPGENTGRHRTSGSIPTAEIGCDGILGSGLKLDKCGVCGGTNTQCEVMSGVFTTNNMGHGYHKITTIPTGAMYINVTELTKSRNYLALEGVNGNKYINMDWKIDPPGNYSVAGTFFIYKRMPGRTGVGEQLLADGPTTEDLNLILISQQKNPGISYEYSVPRKMPGHGVASPMSSLPQPKPVVPQRGQVIIRQDTPQSRSQVSGGVSLSTFLSAGQPAPVFPSTGSKENHAQSPVEPSAQPDEGTSFSPQGPETDPSGQLQSDGHRGSDRDAETHQLGSDHSGNKHLGKGRGHHRGAGQHGNHDADRGQDDSGPSRSEVGSRPRDDQPEEPQADSGFATYPAEPFSGVGTQARELPDSVYQQAVSAREQGGTGNPRQGQQYQAHRDRANPGSGSHLGSSGRRQHIQPNPQPVNPYPGRYQTFPNPNPYYPNGNPNPYPNSNHDPNPYPNRNPYPNQNPNRYPNPNPYPNGNPQRPYSNAKPSMNPYQSQGANPNPYPNPNPKPNPGNPYPNPYPNRYPNGQDPASGRSPSNPQQPQRPYLEIDPIESHRGSSEGSSTFGSSDFSALEGSQYGSRDSQARYGWIDAGLTECSASCAGGIQHTKVNCIEWRTFRPQDPSLCEGMRKPNVRQQACNIEPCPPVWEVTEWMECSRTCGMGRQMRQVMCKQTVTQTLITMVPGERCDPRLEPERVQECHMDPCTAWSAGEWGECNVPCGEGRRQREVRCVDEAREELDESACTDKQLSKPRTEETCDRGPCVSNWFVSEWNDLCSAECGGGHKSRYVVCTTEGNSQVLSDEACNTITKPRTTRTCNSMPCGAVWLTSEWSQCSRECGEGIQERVVLCAGADEPHIIINEEQCAMKPKPTNRQSCYLKDCTAMWFNSDWTQCSRTCGGGHRKRDVKCLDSIMRSSTQCSEENRPSSTQSCNIQQCTTATPSIDCQDRFQYCEKVAKARLCTYMYYRNNCCFSCFNHQR
ncbi:thrombospondin type-1 domain-containing protein 4-like isoform X2 [Acanthaster planci]|uniref:Thrombospondin type-1 domain-containing protein 4-like isoform X2 n=1 Tax=Acanthaster planci TaxID=133434 RepID=A0A8B7YRF0_ACAPL|nr:thrombospondin type-1 domain-containing protein 4-like isoform X2 [Acanthaster planci]